MKLIACISGLDTASMAAWTCLSRWLGGLVAAFPLLLLLILPYSHHGGVAASCWFHQCHLQGSLVVQLHLPHICHKLLMPGPDALHVVVALLFEVPFASCSCLPQSVWLHVIAGSPWLLGGSSPVPLAVLPGLFAQCVPGGPPVLQVCHLG